MILFRIFYVIFLSIKYLIYKRDIATLLDKLGPVFIKAGQLLSTRPDIVGWKITNELSRLQNSTKSFCSSKAKKIVEREIGIKNIEDFNEKIYFSASVAQVHKARLLNGDNVAIKILKPNLKYLIRRDISVIKVILFFVNRKKFKNLNLSKVLDTLVITMKKECDLRFEAANADAIRKNNRYFLYIPKIYWEYTTKNVLVTAWIDGFGINEKEKINNLTAERENIAKNLIFEIFYQIYKDGFFHADIHPGNIIIKSDSSLFLIDFGMVGFLSKKNRIFLLEVLRGFLNRDYEYISKVHFLAGYLSFEQSIEEFAIACRSIGEPIVNKNLNDISVSELLLQLFEISSIFDIKLNHELVLFQKTLILLEHSSNTLCPGINIWNIISPLIENWTEDSFKITGKTKEIGLNIALALKRNISDKEEGEKQILIKLDISLWILIILAIGALVLGCIYI